LLYTNPYPTQQLPISPPKTTSHSGPNYAVIRTVPRVSLAGGPDQKLSQFQRVCSGTWRPPVLTIALPGHRGSLPWRTFSLIRNSWDLLWNQKKYKNTKRRDGNSQKTHGNAKHWFQHPHQHGPGRAAPQTRGDGW